MTVKQIIVGSLIGTAAIAVALQKVHREKGSLFMARFLEKTRDTPQTASASVRKTPEIRPVRGAPSLG